MMPARLLVIDNYDSFTYNLVQMFREYALSIRVERSDRITLEEATAYAPDYILISPGPGEPTHTGISMPLIARLHHLVPILGVCLGMQCLNEVLGGVTGRAPVPVHGKTSLVHHCGEGLFYGLPSPFVAARYHSLMAVVSSDELTVTARSEDGVIMGLSHAVRPLHGVQFHPESFMTEHGFQLVENFLNLGPLSDRRDAPAILPADRHVFQGGKDRRTHRGGGVNGPCDHPGSGDTNTMDRIFRGIDEVLVEPVDLPDGFVQAASCFAGQPGTVVLLSGADLDCARHHILAIAPWMTVRGGRHEVSIEVDGRAHAIRANPFDVLRRIVRRLATVPPEVDIPVSAGLFGYLAYDLKDCLETLPRTSVDDLGLPQLLMVAPSVVLIHDKRLARHYLCISRLQGETAEHVDVRRRFFYQSLHASAGEEGAACGEGEDREFRSGFNREEYMDAVTAIREHIAAGDVYQVNMSQRFETVFRDDPWRLFLRLYDRNPAPFFAYLHAGDHRILSTSPERFLLRRGSLVETRPIKGTRPRGKTPEEDDARRRELADSPKDAAELSMIVDLLRNDIGKACRAGSVRVAAHKRIEAYRNVYHLVSDVEGELDDGRDSIDLIRAAFPGGSITGCPKIRSMEIIDELEPCRRHIYTGAIGYIGFHDTMDLSIAIRTATIIGDRLLFSVGGGIVYDSDPSEEYNETLHKGRTLMEMLPTTETRNRSTASTRVWMNGRLSSLRDACTPVADLGLQYGFGFFETIRVSQGRPRMLDAHVERFNRTWRRLFQTIPPDVTWADVIAQVIESNALGSQTAAVKLLATRGDPLSPGWSHAMTVMARPYTHRLAGRVPAGIRLATFPEPRQSPLAAHKTLNYLYYYLAGQWAVGEGADEALILNPDGSISETNTANLLVVKGDVILKPLSPFVLPGVMEAAVCRLLVEKGYRIEHRRLVPEDLQGADEVLLTNSLMGAAPVLSLDHGRPFGFRGLGMEINRCLE